MNRFPVIEAVSFSLAHAPDLVRYGSKPAREGARDPHFLDLLRNNLRSFEQASSYLPNHVFLGGVSPERLQEQGRPWWSNGGSPQSQFKDGRLYTQESLLGLLAICDNFGLITLQSEFAGIARESLKREGCTSSVRLDRLDRAGSDKALKKAESNPDSCTLYSGDDLVGSIQPAHDLDESLTAAVLLENLATKATAVMAVDELLSSHPNIEPDSIGYVINTGEEAIGDRYQRGGGNLAKAVAEETGLLRATGSDVKAFCCGPMHGMMMAGALVQAGLFERVLVVGGGSLAKLGMKALGHLKNGMPVLEDVLAGFAISIGRPNGRNPQLRLDVVGKHDVAHKSSAQAIAEALVYEPLQKAGKKLNDIDKYAVELHNPEITQPAGSGDVPLSNYRMLASLAAIKGQIAREDIPGFIQQRGMIGFAPTQGHVASAIPFLGHARRQILDGTLKNAFFVAKGSLFLGRMTQLSDGLSILIDAPE